MILGDWLFFLAHQGFKRSSCLQVTSALSIPETGNKPPLASTATKFLKMFSAPLKNVRCRESELIQLLAGNRQLPNLGPHPTRVISGAGDMHLRQHRLVE